MLETNTLSVPPHVCEATGCRRTRKVDGRYSQWICHTHWRAIPSELRTAHRKAKAEVLRIARWPARGANVVALQMARDREYAAWGVCISFVTTPPERPEGLDVFMREMGFAEGEAMVVDA